MARELGSKVYNRYVTQRKLRSRQLEKVQEVYKDYIHLLAKDSQVGAPGRGGSWGRGLQSSRAETGRGSSSTSSHAQGPGSGNMLLQRPPEPPVRPHLALGDVPRGDRQAGSGVAVGVSEPEGFKSAELTPWGRASHAGELWGLRRVRFAGQEGRGDGGQGHRSGQLEGRMSRSFAEL